MAKKSVNKKELPLSRRKQRAANKLAVKQVDKVRQREDAHLQSRIAAGGALVEKGEAERRASVEHELNTITYKANRGNYQRIGIPAPRKDGLRVQQFHNAAGVARHLTNWSPLYSKGVNPDSMIAKGEHSRDYSNIKELEEK